MQKSQRHIAKLKYFYLDKYIVSPLTSRPRYFMSYDFERKLLWYRVPKAGTRTIDHLLREQNASAYFYGSAVSKADPLFTDFFKFAFVRNPVERYLSVWRDKVLRSNYFNLDPKTHRALKELPAFIDYTRREDLLETDEHLYPQHHLIDLTDVDFVGRFEQFEDDLQTLSEMAGLPEPEPTHLNSTATVKNSDAYSVTDADRREIAALYSQDIRIFYPHLISLLND
jgi:hypothetical protein